MAFILLWLELMSLNVIDRGLEDWTAAAILSLIGLFNIFGSLLSGYLSAKMSKKIILSGIYF